MAPLVSVVIAVRNGSLHIREAIGSVEAQTLDDWELIVVNDASDDDTQQIIEARASADDRIRVIARPKRGGPYLAANDGIAIARGTYVARLDGDDVALPDRLERQVRHVRTHEGVRAVGGLHRTFVHPHELSEPIRWHPRSRGAVRWWLGIGGGPAHSTAFFERSAIEEIGRYRPLAVAADRWMWSAFAQRGWLDVMDVVLVLRRLHEGRLSTSASEAQIEQSLAAAKHHLEVLTGRTWAEGVVDDLYRAGHGYRLPFSRAFLGVVSWWRAFERDRSLTRPERNELRRTAVRTLRSAAAISLGRSEPLKV